MNAEQVHAFLKAYIPMHEALVWRGLSGSPQFTLFQTPYFLKLLCEQFEATRGIPKGKAGLFTGFVRQALLREIHGLLFQPDALLNERDPQKLALGQWKNAFKLPDRGILISKLSDLAFSMQQHGLKAEGVQVSVDYDAACDLLAHKHSEDILKAGIALSVLDEDIAQNQIMFFHQLLQEFFAARRLAKQPNPSLVKVRCLADEVRPTLEETLTLLAEGDPLSPLPQTGWEETTLTSVPMALNPDAFVQDIVPYNLPLAARCAISLEVSIHPDLKREIQVALIARTQDMNTDLRAQIAAGLALGEINDPRFERRRGPFGDYLLPPLAVILGGRYPIGADDSFYEDERPTRTIDLSSFKIGVFPVTNAEYALFIAVSGYEDERWWATEEAQAWLRGERTNEGQKENLRHSRRLLLQLSNEFIEAMTTTPEQRDGFLDLRQWTDERFEDWLTELYPLGTTYRQPQY